jgi:type IV pilus assembly protein PilO
MGKLSKQQQQMIALVLIFVFGGGYVYFNYFLNPTREKIKEREVKLTDLVGQIENAERQARRLPQLQAEYAQLQTLLSSLEKQLPTDKDLPGILRVVTREAATENLVFVSLKPNEPKRDQSGYFEVLDFEVQMTGSLQSFVRFMSSLGQQDRIFQFERLSLVGSGQGEGSGLVNLNLTFTLKTYAYVG